MAQISSTKMIPDKIETKKQFDAVLADLYLKTSPWVETHNAKLEIEGLWFEDKANASAGQKSGGQGEIWSVLINGGLARNPAVTTDGFIMIYCHELGHHFAGFPFFSDTPIAGMSVEGESDYYSLIYQ